MKRAVVRDLKTWRVSFSCLLKLRANEWSELKRYKNKMFESNQKMDGLVLGIQQREDSTNAGHSHLSLFPGSSYVDSGHSSVGGPFRPTPSLVNPVYSFAFMTPQFSSASRGLILSAPNLGLSRPGSTLAVS